MRDDFSRTADVKNFEDVVDHDVSFTPGEIVQTCSSRGEIVQICISREERVFYFGKTVVTMSISWGRVICPEYFIEMKL